MSFNTTSPPTHISKLTLTLPIATSIAIAVFSPVAVAGNALILAAIWKKTFVRTAFHILLSGLVFTDLCTGLIAQPFFAAPTLMYLANPSVVSRKMLLEKIKMIGDGSAIYFISVTVLLISLTSIERWLHMSRRSLVTSRRGCFTVIILLIIPTPLVALSALDPIHQKYTTVTNIIINTIFFTCYLTTSFACIKVYGIIRHHQQQVQSNATSQSFGQPSINLVKYKKSVASLLYIVLLFSFCFIPYIVISVVRLSQEKNSELDVAEEFSLVLVFLSSSLNPALYLWRMNDIRSGVKQILCRNG